MTRAQDQNMTNGDFAWFFYWPQQAERTDRPWTEYKDPQDPTRPDRLVYYVVKQVRANVIAS